MPVWQQHYHEKYAIGRNAHLGKDPFIAQSIPLVNGEVEKLIHGEKIGLGRFDYTRLIVMK
ncbi:MAG: hypothetical protein ACLUHE_12720 [Christensenellales bacterium]